MDNTISAFPLAWPAGWKRCEPATRKRAQFGTVSTRTSAYEPGIVLKGKVDVTIATASARVFDELDKMGARQVILSANLRRNLDGSPVSRQSEPNDPGVAVYWERPGDPMRVIAVDRYDRVADNIAAIAATLSAMRRIERHGGAEILERTFTGFDALPPPSTCWRILGLDFGALSLNPKDVQAAAIQSRFRLLARDLHPDTNKGVDDRRMTELNVARDEALKAIGL